MSIKSLFKQLGAGPQHNEATAVFAALQRSNAVITFTPNGQVLAANEHFLAAFGYDLPEVVGQHHRMFVKPDERDSPTYAEFWAGLAAGEHCTGEFCRLAKDGREIWILATYHPILTPSGTVVKIVKIADDITKAKQAAVINAARLSALNRSLAVIEFELDGTIVEANQNFLAAMGYRLDEIVGQHHRLFVDPADAADPAYAAFWQALGRGEFQSASYRRLAKNGQEIWIQATYNPIFDDKGKPLRIVKFATDITRQVHQKQACARQSEDIASSMRELNHAVAEIGQSMERSRSTAGVAHTHLASAGERVGSLKTASEALNGVIDSIKGIAGQINLLALNAAIEAASAGSAGRGFAVVANEVKTLAKQSREAADMIARDIDNVRRVAAELAVGLQLARSGLDTLSGEINVTAAAVQQQSATTGEINAGMQRMDEGLQRL